MPSSIESGSPAGTERRPVRQRVKAFVDTHVAPYAGEWDRAEQTPRQLLEALRREGLLGAVADAGSEGTAAEALALGEIYEELGRGCGSIRSLLTVHGMSSLAIARWGSRAQRQRWLPRLASGDAVVAFALSEPNAGSDAAGIEATAVRDGDAYVIDGHKRWVTFGEWADLYLLFARCPQGPTAFLVERGTPGLSAAPVRGLLGLRASMTADLHLQRCRVSVDDLVGAPGFGVSHVAATALDHGRFSVAWGCVGLAQACLDASLAHAAARRQFGVALRDHQLVQRLLTRMVVGVDAGRALCERAAHLVAARDGGATLATSIAKYFTSTTAEAIASDAVQLHGASGCSGERVVERHFRDAKIMAIIEGSTQIQEIVIARHAYVRREAAGA